MPARPVLLPLLALALAGTAPAPALAEGRAAPAATTAPATAPRVRDAWVAETPPGARHAAAYLVLAGGSRADELVAVASPVAATAEVHAVRDAGGVSRMVPEPVLAVPAHAELQLAPGGRHLMLINVRRALRPGERVPLELRFRHAGTVRVEAEVRSLLGEGEGEGEGVGGGGHHHHHH